MLKMAMIGLKGHQGTVIHGAEILKDVEVTAIADESESRATEYLERPIAKRAQYFEDWRQLLDHSVFDVCCLCDENYRRADQIVALAERNIHIVAEKPLATTLHDLNRIRNALGKSKSRLTMLLTMRHDARYQMLRKIVQSGDIGEVGQATAQKSYQLHTRPEWFKERDRLGGTIPYIGIHALDMMKWCTGLEYTHVAAFHGKMGDAATGETENQASILLRMSNGASATARLDYLRPEMAPSHGDDRVRIAGTKGIAELVYPDPKVRLVTASQKPTLIAPDPVPNLFVDFVTSIREGTTPTITAEEAIGITETLLIARDAADEKRMIELKTS